MNRLLFSIVVIVLLSVIDQGLGADARNVRSLMSSSNGQVAEKRRNKRQLSPYLTNTPFASGLYGPTLVQNGAALQTRIDRLTQQQLYVGGVSSLDAFRQGKMCVGDSNLLSASGLSAAGLNHISVINLAAMNMIPVQSITMSSLSTAEYIQSFGSNTLIAAPGFQAIQLGHIIPAQLQRLGIAYPLQASSYSLETLIQANYVTSQCIPTALGLAAIHCQYLPSNVFSSFNNCPSLDVDPISMLRSANYLHGNLLTTTAFAAVRAGYMSIDRYQSFGLFPYGGRVQTSDSYYQQQTLTVTDLAQVGYVHQTGCITAAGFHAIESGYFSRDLLHSINIWPYMGTPSIASFVAAGYATYSGYLTTLGFNLYRAQYFQASILVQMGIHTHDDFNIFYSALSAGGYMNSLYHSVHSYDSTSVSTSALASAGSVKTSAYVAGSNLYDANGIVNNGPILRK